MTTNGKTEPTPKLDKLIYYYIQVRDTIDSIKHRHKDELAKYEKVKGHLTESLLTALDGTGQEMARTKMGTVSAAVRDTASCTDANAFIDFVREHDAYELMDRRPNGTACKEFAKANGTLPPGVKINSTRYVNVRVPTQKEDLAE
jgi:hypothetical protein